MEKYIKQVNVNVYPVSSKPHREELYSKFKTLNGLLSASQEIAQNEELQTKP